MLSFYFKRHGRISRKATWLAVILPMIAIALAVGAAEVFLFPDAPTFKIGGSEYTHLTFALSLLLLWPSFATSIRRFHDLNMTGWWAALSAPMYFWSPPSLNPARILESPGSEQAIAAGWILASAAAVVLGLAQLFVPGRRGDNRFGPDPLAR